MTTLAYMHLPLPIQHTHGNSLTRNQRMSSRYDMNIGPFQKTYADNTKDIGGIYGNARKQHAAGINMLIREFDYHPPFKRHSDTFTAVPFNPKRV